MNAGGFRYVYGPVPSRRLGRSLGIDLVPFKTCTYDCIYCQLGRTTDQTLDRKPYVTTEMILTELKRKLSEKNFPNYISLAGSGEPTLNSDIGKLIRKIKDLTDIPVTVLTNGSLLWKREVQEDLMAANLVLPSLDAGDERWFHYVDRPHQDIVFERMVEGIAEFTHRFPGEVRLEVLLLGGVTGVPTEVKKIAELARRIDPARIQLNTVSRPPAEDFAYPLSIDKMLALQNLFSGRVDILSEDNPAGSPVPLPSNSSDEDILALLQRRPCSSTDIANGLGAHVIDVLKHLNLLLEAGKVKTIVSAGRRLYTVTSPSTVSIKSSEDICE